MLCPEDILVLENIQGSSMVACMACSFMAVSETDALIFIDNVSHDVISRKNSEVCSLPI